METQQDHAARILALSNLRAMCEASGGTYWVEKVTRSRVWVGYDGPFCHGEYRDYGPMFAVLPCYPSSWLGDRDNPRVVLDVRRVVKGPPGEEGWQAFADLWDSTAFRGTNGEWVVARFDTTELFGKLYVRTQHEAYAKVRPHDTASCHICSD